MLPTMRYGYYLNDIYLHSLLQGDWRRFHTLTGMLIKILIHDTPRADNIMMFDFAECADKCLGWPWRFRITGSDKYVE